MKKNFLRLGGTCLLALCLSVPGSQALAQRRFYCEVKGIEKDFTSGLKIIFDFGTNASYSLWGTLNRKLKFVDRDGKEINFNSMVDAANYMVERGWTFQQAYASAYGGKPVIHWIFYKDAENMEKAREGILTRKEYQEKKKQKNNP